MRISLFVLFASVSSRQSALFTLLITFVHFHTPLPFSPLGAIWHSVSCFSNTFMCKQGEIGNQTCSLMQTYFPPLLFKVKTKVLSSIDLINLSYGFIFESVCTEGHSMAKLYYNYVNIEFYSLTTQLWNVYSLSFILARRKRRLFSCRPSLKDKYPEKIGGKSLGTHLLSLLRGSDTYESLAKFERVCILMRQ